MVRVQPSDSSVRKRFARFIAVETGAFVGRSSAKKKQKKTFRPVRKRNLTSTHGMKAKLGVCIYLQEIPVLRYI